MLALQMFNVAICAKEYSRAADLASAMASPLKAVAREIWDRWVSSPAPF